MWKPQSVATPPTSETMNQVVMHAIVSLTVPYVAAPARRHRSYTFALLGQDWGNRQTQVDLEVKALCLCC